MAESVSRQGDRVNKALLKSLRRREARKAGEKLSVKDVASFSGVDIERLKLYYAGLEIPTLQDLAKLFDYHQVKLEDLFGIKKTDFEKFLAIFRKYGKLTYEDKLELLDLYGDILEHAEIE